MMIAFQAKSIGEFLSRTDVLPNDMSMLHGVGLAAIALGTIALMWMIVSLAHRQRAGGSMFVTILSVATFVMTLNPSLIPGMTLA